MPKHDGKNGNSAQPNQKLSILSSKNIILYLIIDNTSNKKKRLYIRGRCVEHRYRSENIRDLEPLDS